MSGTDWLGVIGGVGGAMGALGGIVTAAVGIPTARAASRSAKAASTSADQATDLTGIERARRQNELTPKFRLVLAPGLNGIPANGVLDVELAGPPGLDYLDEVTLKILDEPDADHWGRGLPTGVSREEADLFVWGPWQFNTGASEQVADNRTTRPREYSRITGKNWDHLSLEHTRPGHWMSMSPAEWQRQRSQVVRVLITCRRHPYDPWFLLCDVRPGMNDV